MDWALSREKRIQPPRAEYRYKNRMRKSNSPIRVGRPLSPESRRSTEPRGKRGRAWLGLS